MRELGEELAEGLGLETGGRDDVLVLLAVDRADRVGDRAARADAGGGGAKKRQLQLGQ